jgi:transposase
MDFLLAHGEEVQKDVFWSTASLLNLEVDIIFFDTTNTYFEIDDPGDSELKKYGHSKHKRDDLPQVTIGLAVTRKGIPVRCWTMPGNQNDAESVDMIQRDMAGWNLGRVIWVMDRGMAGEDNRRILRRAGGHYILGEKLRGVTENARALSRPGRYKTVRDNLRVKEVRPGEGADQRRFVVVHNPDEAIKDKASREKTLARIEVELSAMDKLPKAKHEAAVNRLLAHPSMGRFLEKKPDGRVRVNQSKVREEERLDGKFLLSSSCTWLSSEDIALGYKQLLEVERAFRTMKSSLDLRPVYHSKDDRIRSHVLICWLALLLVRIAEVETGLSWDRIRTEMDRLHLGEFLGEKGRVLQRSELTAEQRNILKKLNISPPKIIERLDPAS